LIIEKYINNNYTQVYKKIIIISLKNAKRLLRRDKIFFLMQFTLKFIVNRRDNYLMRLNLAGTRL